MELISDESRFAGLRSRWRALAESQGNAFLTPEWCETWFRHYGAASVPLVVAAFDAEGALAGLLPLARSGRTIRFIGANLGDRFAPLARPGLEEVVAGAAATAVAEQSRGSLVLHNVDQGAAWIDGLAAAWPRRLVRLRLHAGVIPVLPLPPTWDEFLATRSRNFRSQFKRKQQRLHRAHSLRFRMASDPARIGSDMQRFFALHRARWVGSTGGSTLRSEKAQAYHSDFAAAALERGWLRMWFLEADGAEVAAWYGWHVGGRYSYFNAGWDPAWAHESVGTVLLTHTIRHAIESGAAEYDFLLGDEEYKSRFATAHHLVETVALTEPTILARSATYLDMGIRRIADALPRPLRSGLRSVTAPVVERLPGARGR